MAIVDLTLYSETLNMYSEVAVILPEARHVMEELHPDKKYPVIYCLHGYSDNYKSWITKGTMEIEARKHDCVIVMPNCQNTFYANGKANLDYYDYVTKELPIKMANFFPVSTDPKDTFIMGASMGGYGSFLIAMRNPERYAAAMSFSGAFYFGFYNGDGNEGNAEKMYRQINGVFGSKEEFVNSDYYLENVAKKLDASDGPKPRLLAVCGTEDPLCYTYNQRFTKFITENTNLDYSYTESPGVHDYFFWNQYIDTAFKFFGIK